ncbi:hypothetical protein PPERSA_10891 [Pseudocohnilembus persalinus]|uniref:Uncharacterized protein n=1 Tax=Pseudocohnilembus persalinus TaxID=266149 RepID=A0A0V0R9E9_PSEPJ|nr:hypothetical protein PPERSA_10891 [Pseudocohnilembus persalinus]|eukprot:KRX11124.1 hypothetical protein PPERSA_10891 [Pseudocohnilembus persalinus]
MQKLLNDKGILNISDKNLKSLNEEFIENPSIVKHLDVSRNNLKNARNLEKFTSLQTLIIDKNFFSSLTEMQKMSTVTTFSANQNQFKDIDTFLAEIKMKLPNLTNLSTLKNPMSPAFGEGADYYNYRIKICQALPKLTILDGFEVSMNDVFVPQEEEKPLGGQQQISYDGEFKGTIYYDKRYQKQRNQHIKDRSEGNRFIKNEQL